MSNLLTKVRWIFFFSVWNKNHFKKQKFFENSFDRKYVKIIDILIYGMENRTVFFVFQLNHTILEKTELN